MKKKTRAKSAPAPKPMRKPKAKAKGAPKGSGKKTATPQQSVSHPEPTAEGPAGKRDKPYGGFVLRLYDHDVAERPAVYDGLVRKVIFDQPIKAPVATGASDPSSNVQDQDILLIAKLRRHLWALGFWVFPRVQKDGVVGPEPSGVFDWRTEWAVREFQIAAAMPNVAVQDVNKKPTDDECRSKGKYLSTLSAQKNDQILDEHPSGVVTTKTAETIQYWLDHHYRCPLVIQAFRMKDKPSTAAAPDKKGKGKRAKPKHAERVRDSVYTENIWRHDEVVTASKKVPDVQMYAWDFSGHYDFGEHSSEGVYVGHYQSKPPFGGPISKPGGSWPECSLSPESWQGQNWSEMDADRKSTWRAMAAVAAEECGGALDVVNFWDNCLGSCGHYHWTMPKSDGSGGELCAFIGLLESIESKYPAVFKKCFGCFGIRGPVWGEGKVTDKATQRAYTGLGAVLGGYVYTKDDTGKFRKNPAPGAFAEAAWLRSWQAAYRLEMAARTCKEFRETMWEYAKHRLDALLTITAADDWLSTGSKAGNPKITFADIFSSERGVALALRLHVWRPAFMVATAKKGHVEPILHDALAELIGNGTLRDKDGNELAPADWEEEHESALLDVMSRLVGERCKPSNQASMQRARFFPLAVSTVSPFCVALGKDSGGPYFRRLSWMPPGAQANSKEDNFTPGASRDSFTLAE